MNLVCMYEFGDNERVRITGVMLQKPIRWLDEYQVKYGSMGSRVLPFVEDIKTDLYSKG